MLTLRGGAPALAMFHPSGPKTESPSQVGFAAAMRRRKSSRAGSCSGSVMVPVRAMERTVETCPATKEEVASATERARVMRCSTTWCSLSRAERQALRAASKSRKTVGSITAASTVGRCELRGPARPARKPPQNRGPRAALPRGNGPPGPRGPRRGRASASERPRKGWDGGEPGPAHGGALIALDRRIPRTSPLACHPGDALVGYLWVEYAPAGVYRKRRPGSRPARPAGARAPARPGGGD